MTAVAAAGPSRLAFAWSLGKLGAWRTLNLVRSAPATFALLGIIAFTSYLLAQAAPAEAHRMLFARSSNLHHLLSLNLGVLIRSAFWLENASELFPWAVLFVIVLAPAERYLGTWRWIVVFVSGHVGATAATSAGMWLAINADLASRHLARDIDVGVSYGFFAVAAGAAYHTPSRWRPWYVALLLLIALYSMLESVDVTDAGHVVAAGIGFALYPLLGRRALRTTPPPLQAAPPLPETR